MLEIYEISIVHIRIPNLYQKFTKVSNFEFSEHKNHLRQQIKNMMSEKNKN